MAKKYEKFNLLIKALDDVFKSNGNFSFELKGKKVKKDNWIWIIDKENQIGQSKVHYELQCNDDDTIAKIVIHFEENKSKKESAFISKIEKVSHGNTSISWDTRSGEGNTWAGHKIVILNANFDLGDTDISNLVYEALTELDNTLGEQIRAILKETYSTKMNDKKQPLNQILYGPPGTGKTYNTINRALSIIEPNNDDKDRKKLKEIFEGYADEGRIVFTTFHQSMSYEDFIEGIKPETNNEGSVIYSVKNGIFKELCLRAITPNQTDFDTAYQSLVDFFDEKDKDFKLELKTSTGKTFAVGLNSNNNLSLFTGKNLIKQGTLTKENIQKQIKGEDKFVGWEGYFSGVLNYLKTELKYSDKEENTKPYVLIIDEINRGNVSSIFGELITLIEDSKRLGNNEALTVTLPYSKEKFGVPSNLYIIGTMNTADRSVEALDTALRRRFVFEEMMPDCNLLKEKILNFDNNKPLNLSDLLKTINARIEVLLSRDNLIGHSYFLEVDGWDKLTETFYKNIIPLLQEYFYGDYGKIGLVLGEGFVKKEESKNDIFGSFVSDYDGYLEKTIYRIIPKSECIIQDAVVKLLKNGKKES